MTVVLFRLDFIIKIESTALFQGQARPETSSLFVERSQTFIYMFPLYPLVQEIFPLVSWEDAKSLLVLNGSWQFLQKTSMAYV